MHSFHLVLCADVILKDEYCELIVCYVLENLNSLEDLNYSVNCGRIFHGLFQQLRGEMDIFSLLVSTMTCCPICDWRVLNHSYSLKCCNCIQIYHMKCITLNADEHNCLLANKDTMIYIKCNMDIFSFNSIEEDVEFIQTCQTTPQNELRTSTHIYNHFQSNEADYHIGSEFDPDINFYCEQNTFLDFYANTIQKTHLMRTWFHFLQIISYHFLCVTLIYVA